MDCMHGIQRTHSTLGIALDLWPVHLRREKEEKLRYKTKANKYEQKIKELQKGHESRDALVKTLEGTQDELKTQVQTLQVRTCNRWPARQNVCCMSIYMVILDDELCGVCNFTGGAQ